MMGTISVHVVLGQFASTLGVRIVQIRSIPHALHRLSKQIDEPESMTQIDLKEK